MCDVCLFSLSDVHDVPPPIRVLQDMGGEEAFLPVSVGVEGLLKVITGLTPKDSGSFMNFMGEGVAW